MNVLSLLVSEPTFTIEKQIGHALSYIDVYIQI